MTMTIFFFGIFISTIFCYTDLNSIYSDKNIQLDIAYTTEFYDYIKVLVKPDQVVLFWSTNQTHIFFEYHIRFDGWFGFGISPDSSLNGSNVIITWLNDNGTGYFSNGIVRNNEFIHDNSYNWKLVYTMQNREIKIFKFIRRLKICTNSDKLIEFNKEGNYLFFTWGDLDQDINFDNSNTRFFFEKFINRTLNCHCDKKLINKETFNSKPLEKYENYAELEKNIYHLYWNISDDFLIAEIHVKTTGWVGFGLSPDGKVRDSDIFIGWIKDGYVFYSDRYVYDHESINDMNNDVELLNGFESNGYTVFKIKRPLLVCDPDDRSIEIGTPYVIFPWHIHDPNSTYEIKLNDNNQSTQLNFYRKNLDFFSNENDQIFKINIHKKIIPISYYQYCQAFQVPDNITKKHIYKWSIELPLIDPHLIRSIKLYECSHDYLFGSEINCDLSLNNAFCSQSSIGWNPGAELVVSFPVDVGYPIGIETDYNFFVLNLEFIDLEESSKFIDYLSINLYMTDILRKHELGSVTLGTESGPLGILIPPGLEQFSVNTYCFNSCFEKKFDYITFVMASPQANSAAFQISTKIIRNKTDIGYLHKNNFFNHKYQHFYELKPRVIVTKNDSLFTQCVYSTKKHDKIIQGGSGLDKEVCLYSYFYYPRIKNFKTCKSIPTFDDQLKVFKKLRHENILNFNNSMNNSNLALLYEAYTSLEQVQNFTDNLVQSFFSIYLSSKFYAICDGSFNHEPHERLVIKSISQAMDQCDWKIKKEKHFLYQPYSNSIVTKQNSNYVVFFFSVMIILIKIFI